MKLFYALQDFLFPPLCRGCEENTEKGSLFCNNCWEKASLACVFGRCPLCFSSMEEGEICTECTRWKCGGSLPFRRGIVFENNPVTQVLCQKRREAPEAFAGWMVIQWSRLDWPWPDLIVPMPGMEDVAKKIGEDLQADYANCLRWTRLGWRFKDLGFEEELTVFLIDEKSGVQDLGKAALALHEMRAKRVFALTLLER